MKLQVADNSQLPNPYVLIGWKNEVSLLALRKLFNYDIY